MQSIYSPHLQANNKEKPWCEKCLGTDCNVGGAIAFILYDVSIREFVYMLMACLFRRIRIIQ